MSELLKINVNDHVEKKNGLTYLSWAWAWAEVLKIDPGATWEVGNYGGKDASTVPMFVLPDGSAIVRVVATIQGKTKSCVLPVMDHRNKAIKNPDAFALNTAIMRCLAKAIAMHGLGLYIYAGEDLPEEDKPNPAAVIAPARICAEESATLISEDRKAELIRDLDEALALAETGKTTPLIQWYYGLPNNEEKMYVWAEIPSALRALIKKNQPEK